MTDYQYIVLVFAVRAFILGAAANNARPPA